MTVKAEDRPSGSAGDSASVSTPLFRISVELSLRGVCLSRASEASPLVSRQAHATVANGSFNAALYLHYIGLLVICSKIKFCYKGLS